MCMFEMVWYQILYISLDRQVVYIVDISVITFQTFRFLTDVRRIL